MCFVFDLYGAYSDKIKHLCIEINIPLLYIAYVN